MKLTHIVSVSTPVWQITTNLAASNTLLSQNSHGSGVEAWLRWVLCLGPHEPAIKVPDRLPSNLEAELRKSLLLNSLRLFAKFTSLRALASRCLLCENCPQLAVVWLLSVSYHIGLSTRPLPFLNTARERKSLEQVSQLDSLKSCNAILVLPFHHFFHNLLFRSYRPCSYSRGDDYIRACTSRVERMGG